MMNTTKTASMIKPSTLAIALTASSASRKSRAVVNVRLSSNALIFEMRFPHTTASATALTADAPSSHVSAVDSPPSVRNRSVSYRGYGAAPPTGAGTVPGGVDSSEGSGRPSGTPIVSGRDTPPFAIHCVQRSPSQ
jgi:hypothetical protein